MSILYVKNFSFSYESSKKNILNNISFTINEGECSVIIGKTGTGKSTLLLAIAGLLENGYLSGSIKFHKANKNSKSQIGIVLQNPETQLLTQTIGEEIAFGLENLCIPPDKMTNNIYQALKYVGLNHSLSFAVKNLSMGQKYRLMIAAQLAMSSRLILIDEPCAQLDKDGIEALKQIIFELKKKGISFLICEHDASELKSITDNLYLMEKSELKETSQLSSEIALENKFFLTNKVNGTDEIINCKNISFKWENKKEILSGFNLSIKKGEVVAIYGKNGSGKTTLIRAICGFIKPTDGSISVYGSKPIPKKLRFKVGILFQNPQKQLFETSVYKELSFMTKRMNIYDENVQAEILRILEKLGLNQFNESSPFKLSFGQKHLISLTSIIISKPEIIILDDPFAGIDLKLTEKIMQLLFELNKNNHSTIIWTSHSIDLFKHFSNKRVYLGV